MTNEELKLSEEAASWSKQNRSLMVQRMIPVNEFKTVEIPVSFFMAGSPGAGKTEVSKNLINVLEEMYEGRILRIDPDDLRVFFPGYDGSNSHLFQKAVNVGVERLLDTAFKRQLNFLLDGTLSSYGVAKKNIERAINRGRPCTIIYVYQDPLIAWEFTKKRELIEGRKINKEDFIKQFFAARKVVNDLKQELGSKVEIWLIEKNFQNSTEKVRINVDNIDSHIQQSYDQETLEKIIV